MIEIRGMRSLALLPALLGCGDSRPGEASSERIDCAIEGAAAFEPVCTLERSADGRTLILRAPDGGFRRIAVTEDGLTAADGAEPARVTELRSGLLEVAIAGDRYRIRAESRE